jgi:RimJ/RimL family protein N-acetyltransferase
MSEPSGPPHVPVLTTDRLVIRPLVASDGEAVHRLFVDIGWADTSLPESEIHQRRMSWLDWSIANYRELERLYQPPLGERAVVLGDTGAFVGLVGLVPSFAPFGQLPAFGGAAKALRTMEMGLFWAFSPSVQGRGYASEAAAALIGWAFDGLFLERLVATTEHDNTASIAVMRRLGMTIEVNPQSEPPWFQTVGVLRAIDRLVPKAAESS